MMMQCDRFSNSKRFLLPPNFYNAICSQDIYLFILLLDFVMKWATELNKVFYNLIFLRVFITFELFITFKLHVLSYSWLI